jgi:Fe-S oxidoreductase
MLKQEYPWLDGSEDAALVAGHTRDLFEYLASLNAAGRLDTKFPNRPGKVAYQLPCHLKAQNMGTKSADVLRLTGAEVEVIERCSAVDGTWGLKKEYFELSMKLADPLFKNVEAARPDRVATDCPLAALQINQGTGRTAAHPVRILADAYGLSIDGAPAPASPPPPEPPPSPSHA